MNRYPQEMTGQQAWELAHWCSDTAELIRDQCCVPEDAVRSWWENECEKPLELGISPRPGEYMFEFAERLQAEGYKWAGTAGELYAEEDGYGAESA